MLLPQAARQIWRAPTRRRAGELSDLGTMRPAPWRAALGARVRAARMEKGWSVRRAEGVRGVPQTTWRHVEAGWNVNDEQLIEVARTLGWPSGECFRIMADALDG